MECPCCSAKKFEVCCEPFLSGKVIAQTPEQLMRSRYVAYTIANVDYLLKTTHPSTRKNYSEKPIREWAEMCEWLELEVKIAKDDKVGFYAFFHDETGKLTIHKELSTFKQEDGVWYFLDGVELD